MKKPIDQVDDEFDFGFSFFDENPEQIQEKMDKVSKTNLLAIEDLEKRIEKLHSSILPFLNNLCKNPDKTTIYWPDRVEKIEQFKERLEKIAKGK